MFLVGIEYELFVKNDSFRIVFTGSLKKSLLMNIFNFLRFRGFVKKGANWERDGFEYLELTPYSKALLLSGLQGAINQVENETKKNECPAFKILQREISSAPKESFFKKLGNGDYSFQIVVTGVCVS